MEINIPYYHFRDGSPDSVYCRSVDATIEKVSSPRGPELGQLRGFQYRDITFSLSGEPHEETSSILVEEYAQTIAIILGKRDIEDLVGERITLLCKNENNTPNSIMGFMKPGDRVVFKE
jgi:hypothetical protein